MFHKDLNIPWDLNMSWFWICYGSKYAGVLNIPFPKYKKVPFLEIKDFWGVSISRKLGTFLRKYKKNYFLRKYKKFFNLRVRKFHFLKYKEFFSEWIFFIFLGLGWKYPFQKYKKLFQGFCFLKYEFFFVVSVSWIC